MSESFKRPHAFRATNVAVIEYIRPHIVDTLFSPAEPFLNILKEVLLHSPDSLFIFVLFDESKAGQTKPALRGFVVAHNDPANTVTLILRYWFDVNQLALDTARLVFSKLQAWSRESGRTHMAMSGDIDTNNFGPQFGWREHTKLFTLSNTIEVNESDDIFTQLGGTNDGPVLRNQANEYVDDGAERRKQIIREAALREVRDTGRTPGDSVGYVKVGADGRPAGSGLWLGPVDDQQLRSDVQAGSGEHADPTADDGEDGELRTDDAELAGSSTDSEVSAEDGGESDAEPVRHPTGTKDS